MTRTKQRQTITLEIDLIAYGDGDPEADEIRVNGKSVDIYRAMLAKGLPVQSAKSVEAAVEHVALWAEDPKGWELAE